MSSDTQGARRERADRPKPKPSKNPEGRMPLADHLRELRSRIIISVVAIVVTTIIGLIVHNWVYHQMSYPVCTIKNIQSLSAYDPKAGCPNHLLVANGPLSGLSLTFKISLMIGVILAAPVWSYQLWAFVAPGLYKKEKKYGLGFVGAAVPLFLGGAAIAFWIFPKAIEILMGFVPGGMASLIQGDQFLDFFMRMIVVFGLSFELPLLIVLLNFIGIVSASKLRGWWRSIVFLIFVFAAIATPTGDPVTMCVMAVPICFLFFIALGVATLHDRRKEKHREEDSDTSLDPDEASSLDLTPSVIDAAPVSAEPMVYHPDEVAPERLDDIT